MTAGDVANPRPEPEPRPRLIRYLKEQFRALARTILSPAPAQPAAAKKRKREDQTRGGLMMAARRFTRRILLGQFQNAKKDLLPQSPVTAAEPFIPSFSAATAYLSDTLDWLNLWEDNGTGVEVDEFQPASAEHLYPHL